MENPNIQEIKVVIIGPSNSGKTSILSKFMNSQKQVVPTVGCSFLVYPVFVNNQKIHFNFWDTCGTERFKAVAPFYYRNTQAVIAVIDLTLHDTLDEAKSWVNEMKSHEKDVKFLALAGNKVDDEEHISISDEEFQELKTEIGADFAIKTSAHENIGIQELFQVLVRNVLQISQDETVAFQQSIATVEQEESSCCG